MKLSSFSWEVTAEGRESAKRCSLCSKPCARDSKRHNDTYLHSLVLQKWMSRYPEKKNLTSQFNDHIQKLNQPTGITYVVDYNSSNAHLWALASTFLLAWLEKKMRISVCVHTQFLVIELDYSCVPSWTSSAARDCSSSIEKHTNACACIILAQVHKRQLKTLVPNWKLCI